MATPSKIYELALYHQDITGNPVMRIIAPDFVSEELDAPEQYFSLPIGSRDMQFNTIMGIQLDIDTIELPDRDWPVLAKRADAATSEAFLQRCLLAHRELGLTQHPDRDGQRGADLIEAYFDKVNDREFYNTQSCELDET
jgi:hypothetical protein